VVVPWHLLEADHKTFLHDEPGLHALLSRHFGRVEVFSYATTPITDAWTVFRCTYICLRLREIRNARVHSELMAICAPALDVYAHSSLAASARFIETSAIALDDL
jgi:hypothetical protein